MLAAACMVSELMHPRLPCAAAVASRPPLHVVLDTCMPLFILGPLQAPGSRLSCAAVKINFGELRWALPRADAVRVTMTHSPASCCQSAHPVPALSAFRHP